MPTPAPRRARTRHQADDPAGILLLRAAGGDQEAFAELYDLTASRVHGLALRIARDHHLAEEITQDVFVEVWRKSDSFDPLRCSATSWVVMIAHHRAVDLVRSTQSTRRRDTTWHLQQDVDASRDSTFDLAAARSSAEQVLDALGSLPRSQRRALELAYLDGHTYAEVAHMMRAPLGTTKTRIRTALLSLRTQLFDPDAVTA